jgi:Ca-activated chloride channel homolog
MRLITFIFFMLFFTAASLNDARKANDAFERGNYAEAVQLYRQALEQEPDNARLHFNLGNALYHLGHADEAKESYERFRQLAGSPAEQSFADYNTGRMMVDQDDFDQAVNYFREALRNNPNDLDAKHNYELALRQQQEQQQDSQDDQQEEEGDGDGQNDQQQDEQNQDQPDPGQQPNMPQEDDSNQEQQPQPRPNDMTREEAENILDALEQIERELLENRKKESSDPPRRNERDW